MAVRKLKDPATWVNDQIAGVRNSLDKYRDGVLNPSRDPKAPLARGCANCAERERRNMR